MSEVFRIDRPERQDTAVIFASPHSGRAYSPAFLAQTVLRNDQIRSSEDAFVDQLFADAPLHGAPLLAAQVPPPAALAGEGGCDIGAPHAILAAIDARMGELYVARFERVDGLPMARDAERVCVPAEVSLPEAASVYGVGTGFAAAEGALVAQLGAGLRSFDATALPHAADVLALAVPAFARGEGIAAEKVEPAYLRDNVALTLVEQQAARDAKAKANG